jgi:hypothetical protein
MPWLILGIAFVVNLVVFSLVPDPPAGGHGRDPVDLHLHR